MKLDHIALYTTDLERLKKFYEKYFSASVNEKYRNDRTGLETYFLTFDGESRIEIMKIAERTGQDASTTRTGYVHVALQTGSKEEVDRLTALLEKDGFPVVSYPRITGDGYYESCVLDPDGNRIEIIE